MYTDSSQSQDTVNSQESFSNQTSDSHPPIKQRRIVEDYELGKTLGKGHFGQVKLAQRISTSEICALKIIEYKSIISPRQQELFHREIQALLLIKHKNVIKLNRFITNVNFLQIENKLIPREVLLLDLELCSGGELFDFVLSNGPFHENIAKYCFREILLGVHECHNKNIYHRDLKPENIFLAMKSISTENEETSNDMSDNDYKHINEYEFILKIGDFGLASINENGSTLCKTPVGTRSYQAPEIISHSNNQTQIQEYDGSKADIWSLGVILFILLLGNPPFVIADKSDWWFNAIRLNRYIDFWKAHQRSPCVQISNQIQNFINKFFIINPNDRISINEILLDPWLNISENELNNNYIQTQLYFNKIYNQMKIKTNNYIKLAKNNAKNQVIETEVVFNQCTERGIGREGEVQVEGTPSSSCNAFNNIIKNPNMKPPVFDQNNNLFKNSNYILYTSTLPLILYNWLNDDFLLKEKEYNIFNYKNDINNYNIKFNLNINDIYYIQMFIQIYSIQNEDDVYMLELSYQDLSSTSSEVQVEVSASSSSSTGLSQLNPSDNLIFQYQSILNSFWYHNILLILKGKGCLEINKLLENESYHESMTNVSLLTPLLPPPYENDLLFSEGLRNISFNETETTVLDDGHDDIF